MEYQAVAAPTKIMRTPWNKGKLTGAPPSSGQACLGHSRQVAGRRPHT